VVVVEDEAHIIERLRATIANGEVLLGGSVFPYKAYLL
jgi:hypothetical protein